MNGDRSIHSAVHSRNLGIFVALAATPFFLACAYLKPLVYEAQILIEQKPVRIKAETPLDQFDVTRLTSDMQRSTALLNSRYVMERWIDVLMTGAMTDPQREKMIRRLRKALIVRPVSYTDLIQIRVRAETPDLANEKLEALIGLYSKWDRDQTRDRAGRIISLLQARMSKVRSELEALQLRITKLKVSRSLRLTNSTSEAALLMEVQTKENLYETLTVELEHAERHLDNQALRRLELVTPIEVIRVPLYSRTQYIGVAVALSFFLSAGVVMAASFRNRPPTRHVMRTEQLAEALR